MRRQGLHNRLIKKIPVQNNELIILFCNGSKALVYYLMCFGLTGGKKRDSKFKQMTLVL